MPPSVAAPRPWTTEDWHLHDALRALRLLRERAADNESCHVPAPNGDGMVLVVGPSLLDNLRDMITIGKTWHIVPKPQNVHDDDAWVTYAYADGTALLFRKLPPSSQGPRFEAPKWPLCAPDKACWEDVAFRQASRRLWEPAPSWGVAISQTIAQWEAPVPAWMRPFPARPATGSGGVLVVAPSSVRKVYNHRSNLLRRLLPGAIPQGLELPDDLYLHGASGDLSHPTFFDHLSRPHLSEEAVAVLKALETLCGQWLPGRFGFAQAWTDVLQDPLKGADPRFGTLLFDVPIRGPIAPALSAHTRMQYTSILRDPEGFLALTPVQQERLVPGLHQHF